MTIWLGLASLPALGLLVGATSAQAEDAGAPPTATDSATAAAPAGQTPAPEPPSPPTAEPAPAAPAGTAKPIPAAHDTRPYIILCQDGECVPYTRGCPHGLRFDGVRDCVPPNLRNENALAAELDAEQGLKLRMQERMRPRFTISLEGMLGTRTSGVDILAAGFRFGYHGQVAPRFGLLLRAGVFGGGALYQTTGNSELGYRTTSTDSTSVLGAILEVAPYLGPFGRFYCGPLGFVGYFAFGRSSLGWGMDTVSLRDGATAGAGLLGGVLLGDRERVAIQFTGMAAPLHGEALLMTTVGVVFRY